MAGVAEIVKQGRERRNWSQADLAFRSGVSASTIARTEQDRGLPNSNTLRRIASAIGYEPDALVRMAREPGAEHPAACTRDPRHRGTIQLILRCESVCRSPLEELSDAVALGPDRALGNTELLLER